MGPFRWYGNKYALPRYRLVHYVTRIWMGRQFRLDLIPLVIRTQAL